MSNIFQVLSNLNHNGERMAAGTFFEGEYGEFAVLVNDKVVRCFEEGVTIAEAREIVESEAQENEDESSEAVKPKNTWEAQPDVQPAAPQAEEAKEKEETTATGQDNATGGEVAPIVGSGDQPPLNTGDNL